MLTGIDLLIFALCLIGFGYVLGAEGGKAEKQMKKIIKKEEEKRSPSQEISKLKGEMIAERNRREYELIAQDDKRDFIEQLIEE